MTYGFGTRSYNRSTEARQMKQEIAETKAKIGKGEITLPPADLRDFMICRCRSFRYPHVLDAHKLLRAEYDWRPFEKRERDTAQYWEMSA